MTIPSHDRLTMREASAYTGCSERTLRRYVSGGRLPAYRLGPHRLIFRLADLDALLQRVPTVGAHDAAQRRVR
jgi:excisionase family DNA binding protein